MYHISFLTLLIIFLISCKSNVRQKIETSNADTTLKILTYGLPEKNQSRARNTVAGKYGFRYYAVAGCVVSKELIDSVELENTRTYFILSKRFGKKFAQRFNAETEQMEKSQENIESLIKKEPFIILKQNELEKEGNGLNYNITPTANPTIFYVEAYGWNQGDEPAELSIYYQLNVDLVTKKIVLLSDVAEKLIGNL